MRDVDAAVRRHGLRHLDQLTGGGVIPRRVDERGPDAEGAILHRAARHHAHRIELRGRGRALRFPLCVDTNGRRADERPHVRRRAVPRHRVEPCVEAMGAGEVQAGIGAAGA